MGIIRLGIFRVTIFWVGVFLGGSCPGGDFLGGSFPGWELSEWEFSGWKFSWGADLKAHIVFQSQKRKSNNFYIKIENTEYTFFKQSTQNDQKFKQSPQKSLICYTISKQFAWANKRPKLDNPLRKHAKTLFMHRKTKGNSNFWTC